MKTKKKRKVIIKNFRWTKAAKVVQTGTQTVATELCSVISSKEVAASMDETINTSGRILRRNAKSLEGLSFERKSSKYQRKWKSAKCKGGYIYKHHKNLYN